MSIYDQFRSTAILLLAVLYLMSVLLQLHWLDPIVSGLLLIVLATSLVTVEGTPRIIGYGLYFTGAIMFIFSNANWDFWYQGIERNLYLITMFILVPLLSIPIRTGGYLESLKVFFRTYINRDFQFYLFVKVIVFFISVLINVGSVPLVHEISRASEKSKKSKLLAAALIRGFTTSIMWAPSYAAVALIIDLVGGNWLEILPYGFFLGLLGIFLGTSISYIKESKSYNEPLSDVEVESEKQGMQSIKWSKLFELVFFSSLMIVAVVVTAHFSHLSTVMSVAIISLVYPMIWLGVIGRGKSFLAEFKESYYKTSLPKLKNEVVLFSGAGFFATAVAASDFNEVAISAINWVAGDSYLLLSTGICIAIVLTSAIGVHPIISVTVIGSIVDPHLYGVSESFLILVLLSGWSLGVGVSPSSATVITTSSLVGSSVLRSCQGNIAYTVMLLSLYMAIINYFHILGFI